MAGSWAAVTEGNHGQLVRQSQCEALTQIKDATAISSQAAHARRGAKDCSEYRQAAGAVAERLNVMREQMKGSDRCFRCAPQVRS